MSKLLGLSKLLIVLCLGGLLAGCAKIHPDEINNWEEQSLLTGENVRIRILWQAYFNDMIFDWTDGQTEITVNGNQVLEKPEACRRIYLQKHRDKIRIAFKPGKKAIEGSEEYDSVKLVSDDGKVMIFNLMIPGMGLRRTYGANAFEISVKYGRVSIINQLPMELYIARVLPAEMDTENFTMEALKAQAVVARTWAYRNLRRHLRFGYNFCDSSHCQVYKGRQLISRRAENAVKMTIGEVLEIDGKIVDAFYHSTCGGNTVYVHEAWKGQPQNHLSRVEDRWKPDYKPYCAQSPYADWTVFTSLRRIEKLMKKEKILSEDENLENIKVDFVNRSGRVLKVMLITDTGIKKIKGISFRKILNQDYGKRRILSSYFDITVQGKQAKITGHGLGHGVGMCQWGARGMAQHGFDYKEILEHYFKGVSIKRVYSEGTSSKDSVLYQNSDKVKK